jgi:membrane-bound lytic murein transglycosylase A
MKHEILRFEAVSFSDLPGWEQDDHAAALQAFLKSSSNFVKGQSKDPLALLCREAEANAGHSVKARVFFETHFKPHRVVHQEPHGLVTGYYEPVLPGSRVREGQFQIPVYRRPPDLMNVVDDSLRASAGENLTHARRLADGTLVPYPTRQEIESGALAGQGFELMYLADPVDTFFMHVQGSGMIELPDGSCVRLSYDGKNGHPYTSIGRHLIETGVFKAENVTLDALVDWLRANPEKAREVMWKNASFVFFRELTGEEAYSPLGANEIPLTPGRSLAVDASIHTLGTPVYVVAPTLTHTDGGKSFQRLMIAQDVGSAIRGPERGDIFFGTGSEAGRQAGMTKHPANFFVLLPRYG